MLRGKRLTTPRLDNEIDALFGLPLEEFTAARNKLAQRLKKAGDREGAELVQGVGKPSVAAWTINQLARQDRPAVQALLDAGAAVRKEQGRALARGGGADALRAAQAQERKLVRELVERAARVLERAGRPATGSMLERISSTLAAAAVSDAGREAIRVGRLSGEIEPAGFEAVAGLAPAPPERGSASRDEVAERRAAKEERERRKTEQERKTRELERRARAAAAAADRAELAALEARRKAEEEEAAAEAARTELTGLD
jgi:hypothetical protein